MQSVLVSIQNFWCRHFIMLMGVLRKINQLCVGFIWKGNEQLAKEAQVSWENICYLKSEGGFGLKDIMSWNQTCVMQNIWAIITKLDSLWIA